MIKLSDLAIGYNGEAILEHIDQEFDDGLIYGILAKSGAGKTTLLKTISGLLHPVHGEVVIDGTTYRNADKNPVYMMHQRYSNFGWLSCTENVLIAQRDKKLRSRDDAIKVLAAVGLEQYADKWPSQLSGGMQQRLALARTLYVKPKYLLMDEPLSALDDKTRSKMQRLILDVHAETGNTIIMVTHSQDEAFKTLLHFLNGLLENSLCTLGCLGDILHEDVEEPSNNETHYRWPCGDLRHRAGAPRWYRRLRLQLLQEQHRRRQTHQFGYPVWQHVPEAHDKALCRQDGHF